MTYSYEYKVSFISNNYYFERSFSDFHDAFLYITDLIKFHNYAKIVVCYKAHDTVLTLWI